MLLDVAIGVSLLYLSLATTQELLANWLAWRAKHLYRRWSTSSPAPSRPMRVFELVQATIVDVPRVDLGAGADINR
jgi:hypothetical protein